MAMDAAASNNTKTKIMPTPINTPVPTPSCNAPNAAFSTVLSMNCSISSSICPKSGPMNANTIRARRSARPIRIMSRQSSLRRISAGAAATESSVGCLPFLFPIRSRSEFANSRVTAGKFPSLAAEPAVSKLTVTRPRARYTGFCLVLTPWIRSNLISSCFFLMTP